MNRIEISMLLKVLLLGGTGAMGVYLRDALCAAGHQVIVTSRVKREDYGSVRFVSGDGRNNTFVKQLLASEKPDAIVDFMDYPTIEFMDRMNRLLDGTRHYLFLSSYRVFADNAPLTENSPRLLDFSDDADYLRTDDYSLHKAREENLLRNSGRKNWTILRPSIAYSTERFQFGCLEADTVCYRALRGLPVVIPAEMLDAHTTMTWAGDVAKMICKLVLNQSAMGEDYNVVTSESRTWREVADIYAQAIGLKHIAVPMADYLQLCNPYQIRYDRMFDRRMDNAKVLQTTSMQQSDLMTLEKGLTAELERFKQNPRYRVMNWTQNTLIDRLCGTSLDLHGFTLREKLNYLRHRYDMMGRLIGSASLAKQSLRKFVKGV